MIGAAVAIGAGTCAAILLLYAAVRRGALDRALALGGSLHCAAIAAAGLSLARDDVFLLDLALLLAAVGPVCIAALLKAARGRTFQPPVAQLEREKP
jgi:multisubunit Na+/H+ antiporter MnhF subunit